MEEIVNRTENFIAKYLKEELSVSSTDNKKEISPFESNIKSIDPHGIMYSEKLWIARELYNNDIEIFNESSYDNQNIIR